ncbi:MAG: metallophosphoesterase [Candidatus Solibacter usitatus]|nr:metallophosphoesterase [Candidatus Solibacter usitatus]
MRILVFSDIHNDLKALERLVAIDADYYFAAGDMGTWRKGLDAAGAILGKRAGKVYVIPGNHESDQDIEGMCERHGLVYFHGKTIQAGGYHIAGLGYSNITPFKTPGEYSEAQMAEQLSRFAGLSPLILVCHCPPKDTALDRAGENMHFGSPAVRKFLEEQQPAYFFCGHIHEAEGAEDTIGKTKAVNVGKKGFLFQPKHAIE